MTSLKSGQNGHTCWLIVNIIIIIIFISVIVIVSSYRANFTLSFRPLFGAHCAVNCF